MTRPLLKRAFGLPLLLVACQSSTPPLSATLVNTRFTTAEHMRAGREMQLSGEPFAEILNYSLTGFNRTSTLTDQYTTPAGVTVTDPLAYALAVESYEYSKQPMNNLSFESGAGLSLEFGPVLNPSQLVGDPGFTLLLNRFQQFASESNSGGPTGKNLIVSPAPQLNQTNYLGWPGLWPVFAEFSDFDPSIQPLPGATLNTCSQTGAITYGGSASGRVLIANYECDYNSLNLLNRDAQVTKAIEPDALGYATWKQALWILNYWQSMSDSAGNGITQVAQSDLAAVGQSGNQVVGFFPNASDPTGVAMDAGAPGVFLGDIPMEGWQGLTMIEEIDNKAQLLLTQLLSADGTRLSGTSIATAVAYDYGAPLLFFPASVSVVETPTTIYPLQNDEFFPQPTSFAIANGQSALAGLSGLIGGFAEAYAMTDRTNAAVGGSQPFEATFDGDPFPQDDGLADGEQTLHDRALGVLKIALVDLDRLHLSSVAPVLADTASVVNGVATPGSHVSTLELCEAILALRNAYRGLNGSLQLYSNDTPDALGAPTALDRAQLGAAPYQGTLSDHVIALIRMEADFLSGTLITSGGAVANGYDLDAKAVDGAPTVVEAEAGAVRALLDAYLATSDEKYRTRAVTVYADLESRFWQTDILAYRTTAGQSTLMQYTPIRFGMLAGALRQFYKLVASEPGHGTLSGDVLARVKRLHKLVLNGWNDRNQDDKIQYPSECLGARLEMGERALTGELGHPGETDRDSDCVKEISTVGLPAALGEELDVSR